MLKCAIIPVTPFQQNCSLVWCDETNAAAFVDPGGDVERLQDAVAQTGVRISKVMLTHGHLDHASASGEIAALYGVPIEGPHRDDLFLIEGLRASGQRYGFPALREFRPDRWLEGGDTVQLGNLNFDVKHCPGHTPGHVVFFNADAKLAFVGDVLFRGSVGRSDLPKGSHEQLVGSIRGNLWPLGEDVQFVPGHGEMSTFGWERKTNPYVADLLFDDDE